MVARDIMTTRVVTVGPETPVEEVARLLLSHHVSAVPVVDAGGRLAGIVSEGDLMRRPETATERKPSWWLRIIADPDTLAREYVKTHGRHAGDVMTAKVVTVSEDTPVAEIARLLEERRIKRVPVVRDGRVAGIVSRADLLRGLASHHEAMPAPSADDRELRERVLAAFDAVPFTAQVYPMVTNGVAHLWGLAESENQRRALRVAAENVPGVRAVEDHMGYVPPYHRTA
jgi:CBS domain-containing protein